jgi:manganese efflux pump family protein
VLALLLLAAALGLDNLAAAIGIGVGGVSGGTRVRIAVVFGLFEAGMPVLGLVLGHGMADSLGQAARWLGGAVLVAFGVWGLVHAWRAPEGGTPAGGATAGGATAGGATAGGATAGGATAGGATAGGATERGGRQPIGRLLVGGLVLSADNLAAGFALGAYHTGIVVAAVVFGVVSVGMSLVGLELGARIGTAAGERSELIACALLIVVGVVIAVGVL